MHPTVLRVAAALEAAGVTGEIRELPEAAPTAARAAEQLGCAVGAIANSLVFAADFEESADGDAPGSGDTPADASGAAAGRRAVLVLTSGAHRVDTSRVAAALGATRVGRADPDLVREATGFAIGGVAPVGHPAPIPTLVDEALAAYDVVWAAGGHPHTVFPTTYDELVRLTHGRPAVVAD